MLYENHSINDRSLTQKHDRHHAGNLVSLLSMTGKKPQPLNLTKMKLAKGSNLGKIIRTEPCHFGSNLFSRPGKLWLIGQRTSETLATKNRRNLVATPSG